MNLPNASDLLKLYQSELYGCELKISSCGAHLSICWPKRVKKGFGLIALLGMVAGALGVTSLLVIPQVISNDLLFVVHSIFIVIGFAAAFVGALCYVSIWDNTLDFETQCLKVGKRRIPFKKVLRIGVRRNSLNERLRLGVIEHTPDEDLASVSVILHVSTLRRYSFGVFKCTDTAVRFSRALSELLRLSDDVIVDGAQKWPGILYRSNSLLGAPYQSSTVTAELFSFLLYTSDPPNNYCIRLNLKSEGSQVFNTALVWKGGLCVRYKSKTAYAPPSVILFDSDSGTSLKDYCFIAKIGDQLEVRLVRALPWSSWMDTLDKSEPIQSSGLLKKVEDSFHAAVQEAEKLNPRREHPRKKLLPIDVVDGWTGLAEFLGWCESECDDLRSHLLAIRCENLSSLSVLEQVDGYCQSLALPRSLFMYFNGTYSIERLLEQLDQLLIEKEEVLQGLFEFLHENDVIDEDDVLIWVNYYLFGYGYELMEIKMIEYRQLYFLVKRTERKAMSRILSVCLKGISEDSFNHQADIRK